MAASSAEYLIRWGKSERVLLGDNKAIKRAWSSIDGDGDDDDECRTVDDLVSVQT